MYVDICSISFHIVQNREIMPSVCEYERVLDKCPLFAGIT